MDAILTQIVQQNVGLQLTDAGIYEDFKAAATHAQYYGRQNITLPTNLSVLIAITPKQKISDDEVLTAFFCTAESYTGCWFPRCNYGANSKAYLDYALGVFYNASTKYLYVTGNFLRININSVTAAGGLDDNASTVLALDTSSGSYPPTIDLYYVEV